RIPYPPPIILIILFSFFTFLKTTSSFYQTSILRIPKSFLTIPIMKFFSIITAITAFFFFATVTNAQSPPTTDCTPPSSPLSFYSVSMNPYPVCAGQPFCISISGTLDSTIDGPLWISISGKYFGQVVYSDTQDYCALVIGGCSIPFS